MKKLKPIITLMALVLHFLWPPITVTAQTIHTEKTKTFSITDSNIKNGLVSFNKRVKAAAGGDPTDFSLSDQSWDITQTFSGDYCYGWGQIIIRASKDEGADALIIDFDFSDCDKAPTTPADIAANPYKATNLLSTGEFSVAQGTKMRFSMGSGKRIKSIFFNNNSTNDPVYMSFISGALLANLQNGLQMIKSFDSKERSTEYAVTEANGRTTGNPKYCNNFTISNPSLYGSPEPLVWQVNDPNGEMGDLNYYHLNFQNFRVTYWDNSDNWMPANDAQLSYGTEYGTLILYRQDDETAWTEATGSSPINLDGNTVRVKLGLAVTTFTRPASPKTGQHTVVIDPAKGVIGGCVGVTFHTSLDPEYKASGDINEIYSVSYVHQNSAVFNVYARNSGNLSNPTAQVKFGNYYYNSDNKIVAKCHDAAGLTPANSTFTISANNNPNATEGAASDTQTSGKDWAAGFTGIIIGYTSNAKPAAQPPMTPVVTMPADAVLSATTGAYNALSDIDIQVAPNAKDPVSDVKIYYIISNESVTNSNFDKAKAKVADGGKIHVDATCYVGIRSYAGDSYSGVLSYKVNRVEVTNIADFKQLCDKANAGKLVRLDFPLQTLASGCFAVNKKEYNVYTRDTLDNPIRMVSRVAKDLSTSATPAMPSTSFQGSASLDITGQRFIPAGCTVGTLEFDGDRPVIVLRDEEKQIDNVELCYSGTTLSHSTTYNGKKAMGQGENFVRITYAANRRTTITAADLGRIISIRAKYDATTKTFTAEGATEPLEVRTASGSTTQKQFLICLPTSTYKIPTLPAASASADIVWTLTGLVEYDPATDKYYLMPRGIVPTPDMPSIKPVNTSDGTQHTDFKPADDGRSAVTYIEMFDSKFQVEVTGTKKKTTEEYYLYQYKHPTSGLKSYANNGVNGGQQTLTISSVTFPENGKLDFDFYVTDQNNATAMPYIVSEPFRLTVYDVASVAPVYNSIADVLKAAKEKPELDGTFVHLKNPNLSLAAIHDNKALKTSDLNSMLIKDIAPLKEGKENVELDCLPLTFNTDHSNFVYSYYTLSSSLTPSKGYPEVGDSIAELTFKLRIDANGNVTGDLTNMQGYYKFYKSAYYNPQSNNPHYRPGLGTGKPLFTRYIDDIVKHPAIDKAEEHQFTAAHVGKTVAIAGVKISAVAVAAGGEVATLADEATTFVAKMKTDVPLQWTVFPASQTRTVHQKLISQLSASNGEATYKLTGLVCADGADGHYIEVIDLEPEFGKVLSVCDHPGHPTYIDNQELTDDLVGKAVELKGMKLDCSPTTPNVYTTVTKQPVILNFDNISDMRSTWLSLASAAFDSEYLVKLTGVLRKTDAADGETPAAPYTLDVCTYTNIDTSTSSVKLTFNGRQWNKEYTGFYTSGKLGFDADEDANVYYTIVEEPDKVQYEVAEGATDAEKEAALKAAIEKILEEGEEKLFTEDTDLTYDHTVWIRYYNCLHGNGVTPPAVIEVKKQSAEINSIQELIVGQGKSGYSSHYHNHSPWLVTFVSTDRFMVTDGSGISVALWNMDSSFGLPELGSYLSDFAVSKGESATLHRNYTYRIDISDNDLEKSTVAAPAEPIKAPLAKEMKSLSYDDHKGQLVALSDVKIVGNAITNFVIKSIATAGHPDKESSYGKYDYTTLQDIEIQNALRISLDELLDDNDDVSYRIIGYAMPDTRLINQPGLRNDELQPILEFWPTEIVRQRPVATPVITLSADKSLEAGKATITCPEEGATIEYSTDGGNSWLPYTGEIPLDKSMTIKARASKQHHALSEVAEASFILQYVSVVPEAKFAQAEGTTTVTLESGADLKAESYVIYYTQDGTTPTDKSTRYTAPFDVKAAGVVIKAFLIENSTEALPSAVKEWDVPFTPAQEPDDDTNEPVIPVEPSKPGKSATVIINQREDADGTVWVELAEPTGANKEVIFYTLDGTEPTQASDVYKNEIHITTTTTVKAVLKERGKTLGDVVSLTITPRTTGIDGIGADAMGGVSVEGSDIIAPVGSEAYDMTGRRVGLTGLRQGVYIVRLPDGTALKVSVR